MCHGLGHQHNLMSRFAFLHHRARFYPLPTLGFFPCPFFALFSQPQPHLNLLFSSLPTPPPHPPTPNTLGANNTHQPLPPPFPPRTQPKVKSRLLFSCLDSCELVSTCLGLALFFYLSSIAFFFSSERVLFPPLTSSRVSHSRTPFDVLRPFP